MSTFVSQRDFRRFRMTACLPNGDTTNQIQTAQDMQNNSGFNYIRIFSYVTGVSLSALEGHNLAIRSILLWEISTATRVKVIWFQYVRAMCLEVCSKISLQCNPASPWYRRQQLRNQSHFQIFTIRNEHFGSHIFWKKGHLLLGWFNII